MKPLGLLLALLLPAAVAAQVVYPPDQVGASAFDGGTITNPICGPDGAIGAPTYSFCTDLDTGIFHEANHEINFTSNGTETMEHRYNGTNSNWFFMNPNHASNDLYGMWLTFTAVSSTWEMFPQDATAHGMQFQANNGFTTLRLVTPTGGYSRIGLTDDTTTAGEVTWIPSGQSVTAPTTYLTLTGPVTPAGTNTITLPDATGTVALAPAGGAIVPSTLATNAVDAANSFWCGTNDCYFEGPSANSFETRLFATDPTADAIWIFTDRAASATTQVAFLSSDYLSNYPEIISSVWGTTNGLKWEGTADANELTLIATNPSADRVITLPDATGTVALLVASDALAFDPGSTNDGVCAAAITDTATGTLTTDVISWTFSADPTSTTGYDPSGDMGFIVAYPTADTVNFKFCNKSGSAIDPGSVTLNWRVAR